MKKNLLQFISKSIFVVGLTFQSQSVYSTDNLMASHIGSNFYTNPQMEEIARSSREIYASTTDKDVIVFLGRSPLWLLKYWKHKEYNRNNFSVSFSGKPFNFPGMEPTTSQLCGYKNYLQELGFFDSLKKLKGKLIIVDYSSSGSSICAFYKLLSILINDLKEISDAFNSFEFYNLTHHSLSVEARQNIGKEMYRHHLNFNVKQFCIERDTLQSMTNCDDDQSLGVEFSREKWDQFSPLTQIPSTTAITIQAQMKEFWSKQ